MAIASVTQGGNISFIDELSISRGLSQIPVVLGVLTTVNAAAGSNFIQTGSGNRTLTINNLKEGSTISILVAGNPNDIITINTYSDEGVTLLATKYGAGQNGTMSSTYSLFTIFRVGSFTVGATTNNWAIVGPIHGLS